LGAIYINYAVTVLCMLSGFFVLDYFAHLSLTYQIIIWCGFGVVFPMLFYRYSKSLWLCFDFIFNPVEEDVVQRQKPEFTSADSPAVAVGELRHLYGDREALRRVSFSVASGEMFALLGPNGGGKTTLFKILSTLMPPTFGTVHLLGHDLVHEPLLVRQRLGVVFQHPSLDGKLTVLENLKHHGHLYGLTGRELQRRAREMLAHVGLADRAHDLVETLSGGLQRRAELAKGLLHAPDILVLDEPNTGLDPAARRDFMNYLQQLREQAGVTILLTTHFMEDAERCDRVGILHEGKLVALGAPEALKQSIGGDIVVIHSLDPYGLQKRLRERFGCEPALVDGTLRVERPRGHEFIRDIVEAFPAEIISAAFGKPTLEDVFIHLTLQSYQ
jgi:ABC-2 type transport system ATP-binding protein